MTYKSVSLNLEAYNKLKELKKDNESFSDVILRLATKSNLEIFLSYFGEFEEELQGAKLEEFITKAKEAWK